MIEFMCMHPDCSHRTHKKYLDRARAICNGCLEPFILSKVQLRLAKPHCEDRTNYKNNDRDQKNNAERIFEAMLK